MASPTWVVCLGVCAGCLAAPPDSAPPGQGDGGGADGAAGCVRFAFDDLGDFRTTDPAGCRVEIDGRVRFVQETTMAPDDGCYVQPAVQFDAGSVSIDYGGESDVQVSLIAFDASGKVLLSRWGTTFNLTREGPEGEMLAAYELDFDPAWTRWKIDWTGDSLVASSGPSLDQLAQRFSLPHKLTGTDVGLIVGSWPGVLQEVERSASFDDLEICP